MAKKVVEQDNGMIKVLGLDELRKVVEDAGDLIVKELERNREALEEMSENIERQAKMMERLEKTVDFLEGSIRSMKNNK